jgi:hypothetical protein
MVNEKKPADAARARLVGRWHEQVELYPVMREEIPLPLYLRVNLAAALRNERARCARHGVVHCGGC